jgi:predicted transcriptional regulator
MLVPCESVVKELLPALRAKTARYLYEEYHLSQAEIALRLGVTQAAVSKYLSTGPSGKGAKAMTLDAKLSQMAHALAEDIAVRKMDDAHLSQSVCEICSKLREEDCVIHTPFPQSHATV